VLTIAASLSGKSPFSAPIELRDLASQCYKQFLFLDSPPPQFLATSPAPKGGSSTDTRDRSSSSRGGGRNGSNEETDRTLGLDTPQAVSSHFTSSSSSSSSAAAAAAPAKESTDNNVYSDHIALVNAYNQWNTVHSTQGGDAAYRWSKQHFLSHSTLVDMKALREHFRAYLQQAGFLSSSSAGAKVTSALTATTTAAASAAADGTTLSSSGGTASYNSGDHVMKVDTQFTNNKATEAALVRCVLCAGLFPQIVRLGVFKEQAVAKKSLYVKESIKLVQSDLSEVSLHPSSLLAT
jgi:HrpA-like RNA helicase